MIEEIIGILISIFSMISSGPPRLSFANNTTETTLEGSRNSPLYWHGKIHREYEHDINGRASELRNHLVSSNYMSVGSELRIRRSFGQSIWRSLRVNLSIILAVFPLGLISLAFICLNLNTITLCLQWQHHNNNVPFPVLRWRLIGENIGDIFLNLWFQVSLVILFGWREFKGNYVSTLYVGFLTGAVVIIYKAYLLIFGVFGTRDSYRYPLYFFFLVGLMYSSIIVARKIRMVQPSISLSNFEIVTIISLNFVGSLTLAVVFSHVIIPSFNQQGDKTLRALVVAIAPAVACIPAGLSKYFTMKKSWEIVEPERSFILVYFLLAGTTAVYRIMQADFPNLWIFTGLSLLYGFFNVADNATEKLREKLWTRFTNFLRRTLCFGRLEEVEYDTPHHRRLKADLEIQRILFNYTTLVLSQAHLVLYKITSFELPVWPIVRESFLRIAIGIGIDLVFNFLALFIQVHWYDIPVGRVWSKYWTRHMLANLFILIGIVAFFTRVLLTVFQVQLGNSEAAQLVLRNCSVPFSGW